MEEMLIDLVKQREILFNTRSLYYRDTVKRQEAWDEIGKILNTSSEKAKEAWEKLRRCLCNAMSRRRFRESGSQHGSKKIQPWKYEPQMSFLIPFIETRKHSAPLWDELNSLNVVKDEPIQDESNEPEEPGENEDKELKNYLEIDYEVINHKQTEYGGGGGDFGAQTLQRTVHNNDAKQNIFSDYDETDLFFLSMSRMTKQLPKIEQTRIKLTLSNVVLQAELKNYH